ncbi:cytochrome P450 9e2-like [Ischnura elegans]|uniref:cytochrome P450 9e2-like n=1 Tax=Ischnura elegans TaxID=197161 RepID=UPI001ED8A11B|nr:cytochrome P450 9e2-like [Ischnura elegans]
MSFFSHISLSAYFPHLAALLCIAIWLLYKYYTNNHDVWKNKGIPYLKPLIFFGNIKDRMLFRKSFHEFYLELYNKLRMHPVGGMFEGRRAKLILIDPDLIKQVLVRDFDHFTDRPMITMRVQDPYTANLLLALKGRKWKVVRSLMTPAFTSGKIKAMVHMVDIVALQFVKYLNKLNKTVDKVENTDQVNEENDNGISSNEDNSKPQSGREMEMKELFGRYTFDVISSCAFGVQCDSLLQPEAEFVQVVSKFDYIPLKMRLLIFLVIMGNTWLLHFVELHFLNHKALSFLVALLKRTKNEREAGEQEKRNDFLQLMIDAKEGESHEKEAGNDKESESPHKVLTDEVIISQCLLFLLAGYETSSTLLTFAAYELALNPAIQDKVREEINAVVENHKGITYEALNDMVYLEMVLLEALRKHPPVARIERACVKEYVMTIPTEEGEKKVTIDPGTPIVISVMGLHYDPKHYPEPQEFRPERFSAEEKAKRSPYVFQGFGHGPRNCLGMRFAVMSTKLVMAHFLREFQVSTCAKTQVPLEYNRFSMLLKAKNGIWLNVEKIGRN